LAGIAFPGLDDGAAEVIALEQGVAGLLRGLEHLARFDLFGHHRHAMRLEAPRQLQHERHVGELHVDLHERDVRHQLLGRRSSNEVVERQPVAAGMQVAAGLDDGVVHVDVLAELEHGRPFRQQRRHLRGEERLGQVEERRASRRSACRAPLPAPRR
jgi:hypothetical protein